MSISNAFARLALFALLVSGAGCISVVPYTPNTGVIEDRGYEGAQQMFGEVVTRCRAPRIADGKIDESKFEVNIQGHHGWGWYAGVVQGGPMSIYHNNLGRLDVYENNKVFVISTDERKLAEFLFADQSDAFLFCDLIYSFKTHKGGPGGGGQSGGGSGGSGASGGEERKSSNVLEGDDKGEKSSSGGDSGGSGGGDEERKSSNVLDPQ